MTYGGASLSSHIPHPLQCKANISRHPRNTSSVGQDPTTSTTKGGCRAISRSGPISLSLQKATPRRSRLCQQNIREANPMRERALAMLVNSYVGRNAE